MTFPLTNNNNVTRVTDGRLIAVSHSRNILLLFSPLFSYLISDVSSRSSKD